MVLGVIGYIPEYRGVTGTPPGVIGPHGPKWWEMIGGRRWPPLPQSELGKGRGRGPPSPSFSPPPPSPFS